MSDRKEGTTERKGLLRKRTDGGEIRGNTTKETIGYRFIKEGKGKG